MSQEIAYFTLANRNQHSHSVMKWLNYVDTIMTLTFIILVRGYNLYNHSWFIYLEIIRCTNKYE